MANSFLGKGWSFPIRVNGRGAIAEIEEEELVQQAILQIVLTSFGERIMRRNFGSGLNDLPFEPNDDFLEKQIFSTVTDALARWERRIDVLDVSVFRSDDDPSMVDINFSYRIARTNKTGNVVFPFFLTGQSPIIGS